MWLVLVLASYRNLFPVLEAAFFLLLLVALFADRRSPAVLVVLTLYTPVAFSLPRPYALLFGSLVFAGLMSGELISEWPRASARLILLALPFLAFSSLSILVAPSWSAALRSTVLYGESLAFLIVLMAFLDTPRMVMMTVKSVAVLAAAAFVISLAHFLWRDSMWATQLIAAQAKQGGGIGLEKYSIMYGEIVRGGRIIWAGLEPNYWGAQLQFPLWLAIGLAGGAPRMRVRIFWILISILVLLGIFGSFSRSSFLTVVSVAALFSIRQRLRGALPLVAFGVAGGVLLAVNPLYKDRILGIGENIETSGGTHRLDLWGLAIQDWLDSPFWGHGLGSFPATHGQATHNTYLQLLAEVGFIGFSLYVVVLGVGIAAWYRVRRLAEQRGESRLRWLAEGGLLGTLATYVNICTVTAQDAKLVWLPVGIGVALWIQACGNLNCVEHAVDRSSATGGLGPLHRWLQPARAVDGR